MGGCGAKLKDIQYVDPRSTWSVVGDLGAGTYGKVHKVRSRANGAVVAAKIAPIASEDQLSDFATEINILVSLKHPNITNFVAGYYFDSNLWILIELASGGSIGDIVKRKGRGLEESQLRCVAYQLLSALAFLHENAIIHRDLNASNVLLAEGGIVKIADFGVSAKMKSPNQRQRTFIGTPNWMAPEVIVCENDRLKFYTNKCDIWSFGVTLIECAEVKPPHSDLHPMKALFKITSGAPPTLSKPENWSADFSAFLKAALVKLPERRPSAEELLPHAFCRIGQSPEPLRLLHEQVTRGDLVPAQTLQRLPPPSLVRQQSSKGGSSSSFQDDEPPTKSPRGSALQRRN